MINPKITVDLIQQAHVLIEQHLTTIDEDPHRFVIKYNADDEQIQLIDDETNRIVDAINY